MTTTTYGVAAARAIAHPHIRSISHHYTSRLKTRCSFAKQIFAQKTIGANIKCGVLGRQIIQTTMQNTCFSTLKRQSRICTYVILRYRVVAQKNTLLH